MALRWATERYASYHIWAVQPLTIDDPVSYTHLDVYKRQALVVVHSLGTVDHQQLAAAQLVQQQAAHGIVRCV